MHDVTAHATHSVTHRVAAFQFNGYWEDVGTVASFYRANLQLCRDDTPFRLYHPDAPIYTRPRFLPPTLIQASSSELLLGESIRYTNKARQAGSYVTLQIWQDQLHDWQLFNHGHGSANDAWDKVSEFIEGL